MAEGEDGDERGNKRPHEAGVDLIVEVAEQRAEEGD